VDAATIKKASIELLLAVNPIYAKFAEFLEEHADEICSRKQLEDIQHVMLYLYDHRGEEPSGMFKVIDLNEMNRTP
jgi:hypothetical protein